MKGMSQGDSGIGRGIERGRLGFEVADVGRGGSESRGAVMPGIKRATTFLIERVFWCNFERFWLDFNRRNRPVPPLEAIQGVVHLQLNVKLVLGGPCVKLDDWQYTKKSGHTSIPTARFRFIISPFAYMNLGGAA
jgi:hypothetical protein